MEIIKLYEKVVRVEKTLICNTLFEKVPDIRGLRTYTETQKSHLQKPVICLPLFVLEILTKGFRAFTQQKIRGSKMN
tara:strand:- start:187 stop:417 length:231 start_codon:yes stop_codon:yes gene_type:complete